jgi:hypothetical protein
MLTSVFALRGTGVALNEPSMHRADSSRLPDRQLSKQAKRSIRAQCRAVFDPPPETKRERPTW